MELHVFPIPMPPPTSISILKCQTYERRVKEGGGRKNAGHTGEREREKQDVFQCQMDITGYIRFQAVSIVECAMFYLIFFFIFNILFMSVSCSGGKGSSIVQNGGR